jgi:hypothetical protein
MPRACGLAFWRPESGAKNVGTPGVENGLMEWGAPQPPPPGLERPHGHQQRAVAFLRSGQSPAGCGDALRRGRRGLLSLLYKRPIGKLAVLSYGGVVTANKPESPSPCRCRFPSIYPCIPAEAG